MLPAMHGLTAGAGDLQRAFGITEVGAWEWYMASGLLSLDQPSMALLGVDPDTYDGRIETWISHVHPDDIAWVTAEVDKAVSTRGAVPGGVQGLLAGRQHSLGAGPRPG